MDALHTPLNDARRFLRLEQVCAKVGLGKTSVYALIARGLFPEPYKFGRSSRWLELEINRWVDQVVSGGHWMATGTSPARNALRR